ncbi:MAG: FecR family protein, partial [Mariprofundaceae bacterium]
MSVLNWRGSGWRGLSRKNSNGRLHAWSLLVCVVVLAEMSGISAAFAQTSVGQVTYLNGNVQVLRHDSPEPLYLNDSIFAEDVVITDASGRAKISMSEGSVVFVGRKSRLNIDEYVVDRGQLKSGSFNMLWGKVRFAVSELRAPGSSFNVKTATATIGVRGTVFTVHVAKPKGIPKILPKTYKPPKMPTDVLLLKGIVIAKSIGGLQKVMKPGHVAKIFKTGLISVRKVRPVDLKKTDVSIEKFEHKEVKK